MRASVITKRPLVSFGITILGAILVAISIFIIAHINFGTVGTSTTPAESAVTTFYNAVKRQDYSAAYDQLAPKQQAIITRYTFKLSADLLDAQEGTVTDFKTLSVDNDTNITNQVIVKEQATRSKKGQYTVILTLAPQSDGTWKIVSESGV